MNKNRQPFNGDYYDSDGNVRNLLDVGLPPGRTKKDYMSPFNGDFYASDGSVHNLDELGGGSSGGIQEAPKDGKEYVRKDGDWEEAGSGIPKGCIVMWSGTVVAIPQGWALCNGQNGTPDLRNRFIVGAGNTYTPGNTGGSDSVALTAANLPSHNHTIGLSTNPTLTIMTAVVTPSAGTGTSLVRGNASNPIGLPNVANDNPGHSHYISGNTASTGSGSTHENRPPYYALAYIMKS